MIGMRPSGHAVQQQKTHAREKEIREEHSDEEGHIRDDLLFRKASIVDAYSKAALSLEAIFSELADKVLSTEACGEFTKDVREANDDNRDDDDDCGASSSSCLNLNNVHERHVLRNGISIHERSRSMPYVLPPHEKDTGFLYDSSPLRRIHSTNESTSQASLGRGAPKSISKPTVLPQSAPTGSIHYGYTIPHFGGDAQYPIMQTKIARPLGASSGNYTGVSHFRHANNKQLVTFVFSAGRHSRGSNTFVTIELKKELENPFEGALEQFVDPRQEAASTYTWASTYTSHSHLHSYGNLYDSDGSDHETIKHYALFSGGSGREAIGPSRLYSFQENQDGTLQPPRLEWVEHATMSARFGFLADLGEIPTSDGALLSSAGIPDIIITGTGGLDIYSQLNSEVNTWEHMRSLPIPIDPSHTTNSFMGACHYQPPKDPEQNGYLIVTSRSRWWVDGKVLNAPCLVYDYRRDTVVQEFAPKGQTVSVALLDGDSKVIVGAGGQSARRGQPNLMFDIAREKHKNGGVAIDLSDTQLIQGMPTEYEPMRSDSGVPISSDDYFVIPVPGNTKTRQALPFSLHPRGRKGHSDCVLEVNSSQPSCIYCRSKKGKTFRVIPLPGSEGSGNDIARAADVLVEDKRIHVVMAMFNGTNTVYSFDKSLVEE